MYKEDYMFPATCNKCGKQISISIKISEDETFICDDCKKKDK